MIEIIIGTTISLAIVLLILIPISMLVKIYNKVLQKPNTKLIELEDADEQIVQGTNEALNALTERLNGIEETLEEISNERKEIKGFRSKEK